MGVDQNGSGLTSLEAEQRRARDGANALPRPRQDPALVMLARQLVHFFALLLWGAAGLAYIAGMPQLSIAIGAVVVANGLFAFIQEHRAGKAADHLRDLVPHRAVVIRDGRQQVIDAVDVVSGDRVVLAAGDKVCADVVVRQSHELRVDNSMLTGESVPVVIDVDGMVYAGTHVIDGEASGLVTATGTGTRLAAISMMSQGKRVVTPLAVQLHRVVRTIALIAVSLGVTYFAVSMAFGRSPSEGFLFAIGITVALVPEGLLPTVTLSLAMAAMRMARSHALVRRLESVEALGAVTCICTDKTGTLTCNEMAVTEVWSPSGIVTIAGSGYEPIGEVDGPGAAQESVREMLAIAARCATGYAVVDHGQWSAHGDTMEAAIDAAARRCGVDTDRSRGEPDQARFPFSTSLRRMAVVVGDQVIVKGAPDALAALVEFPVDAQQQLAIMTGAGLRVIAVAARMSRSGVPATRSEAEQGLELRGLIGLHDPPRLEAREAIAACRRAGIQVAMITGDHPATALAIARQVGLSIDGSLQVSGTELPRDDEQLAKLINHDGIVLSRIEPEDKLRIARALQLSGHVVAMTGDGVNDGPALHQSDIGIAMGASGSDVARDAADLVLLDDNFSTIVAAIEQGRAIDANIKRFLTYHLIDNVAEMTPFAVWAISGGMIPLAIGVIQVLALDLATDTLAAVALGAEPPDRVALQRSSGARRLLDRRVLTRAFFILGPVEAMVSMSAFLVTLWSGGWRIGDAVDPGLLASASGAAFLAVVFGQAAAVFACRSDIQRVRLGDLFNNRLIIGAKFIELMLAAAFLSIPLLATLLGHRWPTVTGCLVAALSIPAVISADALSKIRHPREFA